MHVVWVARQQSDPAAGAVCGHGDDGVDGVIPVGSSEELSCSAPELWGDRVLVNSRKKSMDPGVTLVRSDDLG
jgi:hypothetical protein